MSDARYGITQLTALPRSGGGRTQSQSPIDRTARQARAKKTYQHDWGQIRTLRAKDAFSQHRGHVECREQHKAKSRRLRAAAHFRDIVGWCRVGEVVRIPACPSCFSSVVPRLSMYRNGSSRFPSLIYLCYEGHSRFVATIIGSDCRRCSPSRRAVALQAAHHLLNIGVVSVGDDERQVLRPYRMTGRTQGHIRQVVVRNTQAYKCSTA